MTINSTNDMSHSAYHISTADLFRREWQVKYSGLDWLYPLVLFLIIATMFPLSVGAEPQMLLRLCVPIVWIATLLSLVIGVDGLFKSDYDNGVLAQLVAAKASLPIWVLTKMTVHWLLSAGIMSLLSFLAVPLFGLPMSDALVLSLSIVVASPMLFGLSAMASALTLAIKNGAILVPLIALPMQLPVLIFATGLTERAMMGMAYLPILAMLLAGSIIAVIISPWVIAFSLKLAWQG